jgi:RNA-directed DNA polymerase
VFGETAAAARAGRERILPAGLAERGLSLSPEKTRIVPLTEGFDFLSFNSRPDPPPQTSQAGYKLGIKPSTKAVRGKVAELRDEGLALRGHRVKAVRGQRNPIRRGWANYHRRVVAARTFNKMDAWRYQRARRYAKPPPNKSWRWRRKRDWGRWNQERDDQGVFGAKHSGKYLLQVSWCKSDRHELVRGRCSPDDPELRDYWWERHKGNAKHLSAGDLDLANDQGWVCRLWGMDLINGEELHRQHTVPRARGGSKARSNRELVHLFGHAQETKRQWGQAKESPPAADLQDSCREGLA